MSIIGDLTDIVRADESKEIVKDTLDTLVNALFGDLKARADLFSGLAKLPASAKTVLFYVNFDRFLTGVNYNPETQRAFQEFLNHENKRQENSKRIIQFIDEMDSDFKVDALINLTQSVSYKFITKREYFKLSKIIENMIIEDLEYLKENLKRGIFQETYFGEDLIQEVISTGLIYDVDNGGYAFSKMAFHLDKFGLSYGNEKYKYNGECDFIPSIFPEKQGQLIAMTEEEIDEICKM